LNLSDSRTAFKEKKKKKLGKIIGANKQLLGHGRGRDTRATHVATLGV